MVNQALLHHNETQFRKEVIASSPQIYTAVGFAASTQHMVIGEDAVTIIDTSESTGAAENVLAAFREITDKPVGKVIYTHSHRDHISGTNVFVKGRCVPIVAHHGFASDLIAKADEMIAPRAALARRTKAQFGIGLTPQERVSLGCGPGDRPMAGLGAGHVPPNVFVMENQSVDLFGVKAEIIMAPGETPDHIAVWFPETRVLIPGDNWYHAFPNLYAIRGTPYRDFQVWADTLADLATLSAAVMAPGHTRPVFGADLVEEVLTSTRSAILHVMQHTADGMDQGLSLDDIVDSFQLPADISDKPWLGEFYGKAAWSIRAFSGGVLGWYEGNPTHLGTLSGKMRAQHMARLCGGTDALMRAAESTDDIQWRLELCDHLLALEMNAYGLKAAALETLAETEINATARNTYLFEAHHLRAKANRKTLSPKIDLG